MLCTLDDIKTRLGIGSEFDAMLTRIIASFASYADTHTRRTLIAPAAAVTENYTGCGNHLQLRSYPLIAITSIKEAVDYDFANADALVLNDDYRPLNNGLDGVILRLWTNWLYQPDGIQIVHRSGFCAAGVTPAAGEYELPSDLREAAIEQVAFIFKRRDDSVLASTGVQPGTVNVLNPMDLLPMVKGILDKYTRIII